MRRSGMTAIISVKNLTKTYASGFQALNRKAIALFAADYPHDYPEAEALVLLLRHRLRLREVAITMRPRAAGRSSIQTLSSGYYMVKVLLAQIGRAHV